MTKLLAENDEYHFIPSPMIDRTTFENIIPILRENGVIIDESSTIETIIEKLNTQDMCNTIDATTNPVTITPHAEIFESFHTFKYQNMFYVGNKGTIRASANMIIQTSHLYINVICNDVKYGKGYGKLLINKLSDICRSMKLSYIELYADPGEDEDKEEHEEKGKLIPYYRSLGFKSDNDDPNSMKLETIPPSGGRNRRRKSKQNRKSKKNQKSKSKSKKRFY